MQVSYSGLTYGMYVKTKTGKIVWQISIICSDRIIYKSTTTKSIRVLKCIKHKHKTFINVTELFNNLTININCPF